jgi:nitrile hydratase
MNGIHDMGGMHGLGAIEVEVDEPAFHATWEGRLHAMRRLMVAAGKLSPELRPAIESIPAAEYLRMSYYERWLAGVIEQLIRSGLVTRREIETGQPAPGSIRETPSITPADAAEVPFRVPPYMLTTDVPPRFRVGQGVRARNIHPQGHTRLPRYVRGRNGVITRLAGVQAFPDTGNETPQHVYSVRFAARELWGQDAAPRDAVFLDLWEDYLEPA